MSLRLEVCVNSVADAVAAAAAGADRIELCSALELGGLTPSWGTIRQAMRAVEVPVVVMVRSRAGGFAYDDDDFRAMLLDIEQIVAAGAAGAVFGFLAPLGTIDCERCAEAVDRAAGRETIFHRAFDFVPDPSAALEQLIELGVTRVLTSGQAASALDAVPAIRRLIDQADGRIEILPGGGLDPTALAAFVQATGCDQVHMGLGGWRDDRSLRSGSAVALAASDLRRGHQFRAVDADRVRQVKQCVRQLSS